MRNGRIKQYIEITKLRYIVIILGLTIIGLLLLYLTIDENLWTDKKVIQLLLREVSGLILVSVTVSLIWEFVGKRSFLDEILIKTQLAKNIELAGIIEIPKSFRSEIQWQDFFKNVKELDIFFAYGRTWRNININSLKLLAEKEGLKVRIVLPDYEDELTVNELARRFEFTPEELTKSIEETEGEFRKIFPQTEDFPARIEIRFLKGAPVYSFYRFDDRLIFALYSHLKVREIDVPTFICRRDGFIFKYFNIQFESMIEKNLACPK